MDGTFNVTTAENTTGASRTGTITVTAGDADPVTVTVTQEAQDTLSVSPESLTFDYTGTPAQDVTVTTSASSFAATADQAWVSIGQSAGSFTVSAAENTTGASRTATITVTAGTAAPVTVTVTQNAQATLEVSPTALTFGYNDADAQEVSVSTTADTYTATPNEDWITVTQVPIGAGTQAFHVEAHPHEGEDFRNATITVKAPNHEGCVVAVEQLFPPYTHKIEIDFGKEDNTLRFGPDSEWETQSTKVITKAPFEDLGCHASDSWISVEMNPVGGDVYVLVRCEPNRKDNQVQGAERTGYVYVSATNGYPAALTVVQGQKW